MRSRGSITGPLVIIFLGFVFLLHAISPDFPLADWLGQYWPYLLIVWGVVALLEVAVRALGQGPIPANGVSGGAWLVVILICLFGFSFYQIRRPEAWWQNTDWSRGFDDAFGEAHEYSVNTTQRNVGNAPRIVIENFRGDAKIAGVGGSTLTVSGHKTVRALKESLANKTDADTPVDVSVDGNTVTIQCHQNRAAHRTSVTTNLDLSVPRSSSVQIDGISGDFDVSSLAGNLVLRSRNAGIRLQDIGGNVDVDTRRSDLIRCTNLEGNISLRGHGSDVELNRIQGSVGIDGDYAGTVSLRSLSKSVRVQDARTSIQVEQVPGEIRLDHGSLAVQNAVGPLRINAHLTDVDIAGLTNALEISVDRGDVDLKPVHLPLSAISVHSGAGNIELALPSAAAFVLTANTERGQVENDFGDGLEEETTGHGARLQGTVGSGPGISLATGRGMITVRKTDEVTPNSVAALFGLPRRTRPSL